MIEQHKVKREGWGPGPWDGEPDKVQWIDPVTGLDCLIVRTAMGHLCGYVGVSEGHDFFGVGYSNCPQKPHCDDSWCSHSPGAKTDVHGGLTYSDRCAGNVCHVPEPGRPDNIWWLGFDCAHSGDLSPAMNKYHDTYGSYKELSFVKAECAKLASQLAAK